MKPVNTHLPERVNEHHGLIHINREILHPDNWTLIPETGCWAWNWRVSNMRNFPIFTMSVNSNKQREFKIINVRFYIMGIAWPQRLIIEEMCDPRCINPDHFVEIAANHAIQRVLDLKHPQQILTPEQAWFIKFVELKYDEETDKCAFRYKGQTKDLAAKYGVSDGTISGIKNGKRWRFLNIDDFGYIGEE